MKDAVGVVNPALSARHHVEGVAYVLRPYTIQNNWDISSVDMAMSEDELCSHGDDSTRLRQRVEHTAVSTMPLPNRTETEESPTKTMFSRYRGFPLHKGATVMHDNEIESNSRALHSNQQKGWRRRRRFQMESSSAGAMGQRYLTKVRKYHTINEYSFFHLDFNLFPIAFEPICYDMTMSAYLIV